MVYTPEWLLTCAAESRRGTILSYWQARLEVARRGVGLGLEAPLQVPHRARDIYA